ncbi:hypothetical protein MHC_04655 [Mycoplasma haemocanis str. Illinois]|uniref:Uncharacterized protein n=1 Tax=Mycoplasma haemocanis (strain Illinois) TaxID=1111676 RepID=H6N815_MYCHN|nr:hypothetical protein [Mycoplasma haemocanis]AEW45787.1 hypothetical protein MHC_04655 [Mycoplasma haemocanis str. Illinois]
MSYLVKGLIGAAGCSGICGGGYLLSQSLKGNEDNRATAKTLITSSGRTLLDASSNQWVDRWSEYVKEISNPLGIVGYDEKSKTVNQAPEEFKNACLSKVNEKVSGEEDRLFQALAKHCVQMTTISDLIDSVGKVSLDSTPSKDGAEWTAAWGNYVKYSEDNKWGLDKWEEEKGKNTVPESFKTKCKAKKDGKAFGVKDVEFKNYVDWCTKDKPATSAAA